MVPRKRKGANDTVERTDAYWAVYQRAEGAWIEPRGVRLFDRDVTHILR